MRLILLLAFRNIFRQKKRSFFTASSIDISYLLFSVFIGIDIGSDIGTDIGRLLTDVGFGLTQRLSESTEGIVLDFKLQD